MAVPEERMPQTRSHRSTQIAIALALLIPLATAGLAAWTAWRSTLQEAEASVSRAADAVAEHALRILEAQRLAALRVDDMLRGWSDADIRANAAEVHARLREVLPDFPLVRAAVVIGADGEVLVNTSVFPVRPGAQATDRSYFHALQNPWTPQPYISPLLRGRLDESLFFAVAVRRTGSTRADGTGQGVINISVDPLLLGRGFVQLLGRPESAVTLLREDGHFLARHPLPADLAEPLPPNATTVQLARAGIRRASFRSTLRVSGEEVILAFRKVEGWPAFAIVARGMAEVRAAWRRAVALQLAWGAPAALLLVGAVLRAARLYREALASEASMREEAARRAMAEAQRAAESRFRAVFDSGAVGMAVYDVAEHRTLLINDRLLEMTGHSRAAFNAGGFNWRAVTPPEYLPLDEAAQEEGRRNGSWLPYEKEYQRPDGSRLPVRVSSAPLPGEPGRVAVIVQDISDQRAAEERRDLLMAEVNHRAKNALATAQAALRMTKAESVADFVARVDGRIGALAQAMAVLAATGWTGVALEALVRAEMRPFLGPEERCQPRLHLAGPPVLVAARAVQPLTMALHELATNAVKYGALSGPGGMLALTWRVLLDGRLEIGWRERGGPPLAGVPQRQGFGTRVLNATIVHQLRGTVALDWQPEGLACTVTLPVGLMEGAEDAAEQVAA